MWGWAIGAGTDVAMESADIVLMRSDLNDVPAAIELSQATIPQHQAEPVLAFFYNIIGIPIAAGCWYAAFDLRMNPMIAALAMSFSSVFVVGNALRLRLFKPRHAARSETAGTRWGSGPYGGDGVDLDVRDECRDEPGRVPHRRIVLAGSTGTVYHQSPTNKEVPQ